MIIILLQNLPWKIKLLILSKYEASKQRISRTKSVNAENSLSQYESVNEVEWEYWGFLNI